MPTIRPTDHTPGGVVLEQCENGLRRGDWLSAPPTEPESEALYLRIESARKLVARGRRSARNGVVASRTGIVVAPSTSVALNWPLD